MPKIKPLGKKDYGLILQGELRAARNKAIMDRKTIAKKTNCSYGTVRNHEVEPQKIPLGWLKLFIKATDMNPESILEYLYEKKYEVRERR